MSFPMRLPQAQRGRRLLPAARWLLRAAVYVFSLLIGGLLFAYLSDALSFVASFVWKNTNPVAIRQAAWIAGVIVSAIGIPLGWVKVNFFGSAANKTDGTATPAPTETGSKEVQGFWPCVGFFAVAGFILGLAVAGLLVMSWFSISVSPFAPAGWSQSIQYQTREFGHGVADAPGGWTSKNPVLLRLMWMPVAILISLGAIAGIIVGTGDVVRGRKKPVTIFP